MYDYVIIGGGIVGLSTGMALLQHAPGSRLLLIEKECGPAQHQTGHNSGVIHSGIYYKPGSLKAQFAIEGARLIPEFCRQHNIPYEVCGKIIVATEPHEIPLLENIHQRGLLHQLQVTRLTTDELRGIEPHCAGLAAIKVPTTGITDYARIAQVYGQIIQRLGGEIRYNSRLLKVIPAEGCSVLETTAGTCEARMVINCAGLYSDRVAQLHGTRPEARIVPFRGEYYELKPERRYLCKHLIYPVPNPAFPFLGVHFTRMVNGDIHCGPNAVLSLMREGYHKTNFNLRDAIDVFTYKGFWKLASKNWREGTMELWRSISKAAFVRSLQRLIPEIQNDDVIPSGAGVRAQALLPTGGMVDDFLIVRGHRSLHVCNAPSPAATASIPIGRAIAAQVLTE